MNLPDFLTHYHLHDRRPFLTLSDLSEAELETVLADLRGKTERKESRRMFADWYVSDRRKTELLLREIFIRKGGKPERQYPHYLVWGVSEILKGLAANTQEVRLPLASIPKEVLSFTWPDSMASMQLATELENRLPYHGDVFTFEEISAIVQQYGFPEDALGKTEKFHYPVYIEAQLWSDEPLRELLG